MPTIKGNYLIEVDGVSVCRAQEIALGETTHGAAKIYTGDRANPTLVRGKYEVGELTIKHAMGLGTAGADFITLFRNYIQGIDLTKLNIRIVTLNENGFDVLRTDDYVGCVPTKYQPENKDASSSDIAMFSISFMPEDHFPSE